jgi:hypothetical protein
MTDQTLTIDQELILLKGRMLNFAEILYSAAREGRIAGHTPMTHNIWPSGTIYTHLARGDFMRGRDLAYEIRVELGQSKWNPSPLQLLVGTVQPGDKPATSEPLAHFVELLRPYLLSPDTKLPKAEQQRLW